MSGGDDRWLRAPSARALLLAALTMSLVLAVAFVVIDKPRPDEVGVLVSQTPMTDQQSRDQVVDAARQIVTAAQLEAVTGSYTFLSCTNEQDPPYQPALYLNFALSQPNSTKRIREIADALVADGWSESPSMGEHFGRKLTRDGVTSTFTRTSTNRTSERCASMGNAAIWPITATTIRLGPTSPASSVEAALQQHGVQPAAVFEPDRSQSACVDETPITVQRKGSVGAIIHDDGDDLTDARI